MRSPASTAIATSIGLRHLVRVGAPEKHPTVVGAIDWLDGALDRENGVWPIVSRDVGLAPHAPWWTWSEGLAANWNGFHFNPTAEILAHLYHWRAATPAGLFECAEAGLRRALAEIPLLEGAYDLKCAIRLAEADGLPADLAKPLEALVRRSIAAHDPADDHASPFDAAATPASLFADLVDGRIEPALTGLIDSQAEDGGWTWNPDWGWGFVDRKAWAAAHRDWRGQLTRETLETLLAYGRVESLALHVRSSRRRPGTQERAGRGREPSQMFYTYILASRRNGTLYVGMTDDLIRRMVEHKGRTFSGFAAKHGVNRLVWFEDHPERHLAFRRERQIKERQRLWKIGLIERSNPSWRDLTGELGQLITG
jgi:putative endonuclease